MTRLIFFLNDIGDPSRSQTWRSFLTDVKRIAVKYVKGHLSHVLSKFALGSTTFHPRNGHTNVSASASIMRRLVEDVTGKKIEHLIKRSLSPAGTTLRRNVQLVRSSRRSRDAYAAFPTGVFPENAGQLR